MTLTLSVLAMPLAMILGLAVALGRMYGPGFVRAALGLYVEALRGTPVPMPTTGTEQMVTPAFRP